MNDAFGKIIVCGDYEGDLKALVDSLNSLQWGFEWAVKQSRVPAGGVRREFIVPKGEDLNANLLPVIGDIFVLSDGRRCLANEADESFVEQWEAEEGEPGVFDYAECTLGELSALISPHLNKGTIEFVAVLAHRTEVRHERLLVRSDGSAEYHDCTSETSDNSPVPNSGTYPYSEYYEPESSKGPRSRKHSRSRGSRSSSDVVVDRVATR